MEAPDGFPTTEGKNCRKSPEISGATTTGATQAAQDGKKDTELFPAEALPEMHSFDKRSLAVTSFFGARLGDHTFGAKAASLGPVASTD